VHSTAPAPVCVEPTVAGGASLKITSKAAPAPDQVNFKWGKAPVVPKGHFGAPGTSTSYALCIYAGDGTLAYRGSPSGGPCGVAPCWKAASTGWIFTSKTGAPDGVTGVKLKEGSLPLKAQVQVKAKGTLALSPLPLPAPVVVQLRTSDGACWGAAFPSAIKSDGTQFVAKSSIMTSAP
jgi:hypothetical protein